MGQSIADLNHLTLKDLDLITQLGRGAYGDVFKVKVLETGEELAMKVISMLEADATHKSRTLLEVRTLHASACPHLVSFRGAFVDGDDLHILLELMWGSLEDLSELVRGVMGDDYLVPEFVVQHVAHAVTTAMRYLKKEFKVMHRDLKPDNCLTNAHCVLKICDFGLAKQHIVPDYEAVVVTRAYRAPELFLDPYNYSEAIDMWAVGMMILEFLSGDARPWLDGPTDLSQLNLILDTFGPPPSDLVDQYPADARSYILGYTFPPFVPLSARFPDAPPDLLDLATRLLDMDWRTRLSAADALDHPVFDTEFRDRASEIEAPHQLAPFDFELAPSLDASTIRALLFNEMLRFHPEAASHQAYTADLYSMLHPSPGPPSEPVPAAMATSPNYAFGSEPATSMAFPDDEPEFMSGGAAVGMDMGTPTLT